MDSYYKGAKRGAPRERLKNKKYATCGTNDVPQNAKVRSLFIILESLNQYDVGYLISEKLFINCTLFYLKMDGHAKGVNNLASVYLNK